MSQRHCAANYICPSLAELSVIALLRRPRQFGTIPRHVRQQLFREIAGLVLDRIRGTRLFIESAIANVVNNRTLPCLCRSHILNWLRYLEWRIETVRTRCCEDHAFVDAWDIYQIVCSYNRAVRTHRNCGDAVTTKTNTIGELYYCCYFVYIVLHYPLQ